MQMPWKVITIMLQVHYLRAHYSTIFNIAYVDENNVIGNKRLHYEEIWFWLN